MHDIKSNYVKYRLVKQTLFDQLDMSGILNAYTNKQTLSGAEITALLLPQDSLSIHGDKWYLRILQTTMRRNQRGYRSWPTVIKKSRLRIKTVSSQLSDQMLLKRNYLVSFCWLQARIIAKSGFGNLPSVPQLQNNCHFNHKKYALAA